MDTNVLNTLLLSLAQDKAVVPASASLQMVTITIAALSPLISALAVYFVRLAQKEIAELKENVNGKMGALLSATSKAAHANGMTEQRATEAMIEAAHAKGVIEQLKATVTAKPEVNPPKKI